MNREQLMVWSAGVVEASGVLAVTVEQGVHRQYHAISLVVILKSPQALDRLIDAAGNAEVLQRDGQNFFHMTGYSACQGFLKDLWPYFTSDFRQELNMELRRYKMYRSEDLDRRLKNL